MSRRKLKKLNYFHLNALEIHIDCEMIFRLWMSVLTVYQPCYQAMIKLMVPNGDDVEGIIRGVSGIQTVALLWNYFVLTFVLWTCGTNGTKLCHVWYQLLIILSQTNERNCLPAQNCLSHKHGFFQFCFLFFGGTWWSTLIPKIVSCQMPVLYGRV